MNLVAWPADLGMALLAEVLQGGAEKVAEAGAELAGGHSIDDKEPKFGLAVTGLARPEEIVYNAGAQPGDKLVLTKRLGIGVLASALKKAIISEHDMLPAMKEAAVLNAAAAAAMTSVGVHACTDVSGFGLAGHLGELLSASEAAGLLRLAELPLHEGVLELIAQGVYAGGLRSNQDFVLPQMRRSDGHPLSPDDSDPAILTLFDPQTSGGLLISVAPERHPLLLHELAARGASAWTIGEVTAGPVGRIVVEG
jgi:selenide,water dikinase